jgi:hypothetical protein
MNPEWLSAVESELQDICTYLKEWNYSPLYLPKSPEQELPMVAVSLDPDTEAYPTYLYLTYLPSENLDLIELLQFYADYPFYLPTDNPLPIYQLINRINSSLPIGAFNLDMDGMINYKYTFAVDRYDDFDKFAFKEVTEICVNTLKLYAEEFVNVIESATGSST